MLHQPQLRENFLVVLADCRRLCLNARTIMRKSECCNRHFKTALYTRRGRVTMNDAAGCDLRIGDRLTHGTHARRWDVAPLEEFLPFVGGASFKYLGQHCGLTGMVMLALVVGALNQVGPFQHCP